MFDRFHMSADHAHKPQERPLDEWISLQEASDLLGVAPSTLRRWGDAGQVPMKRTMGGHRRFPRTAIARMVSATEQELAVMQPRRPLSGGWGVDERELARQEWHSHFAEGPITDRMRTLGQRLLGLLIQYINRREDDSRFLSEARAVGTTYGREAHEGGISLHDTIEAFLFFRGAFSQVAMPLPGIAQPTDLAEAAALHARLDRFMDTILLGLIAGYEGSKT
jgi:excisionase family DNA binding protein